MDGKLIIKKRESINHFWIDSNIWDEYKNVCQTTDKLACYYVIELKPDIVLVK